MSHFSVLLHFEEVDPGERSKIFRCDPFFHSDCMWECCFECLVVLFDCASIPRYYFQAFDSFGKMCSYCCYWRHSGLFPFCISYIPSSCGLGVHKIHNMVAVEAVLLGFAGSGLGPIWLASLSGQSLDSSQCSAAYCHIQSTWFAPCLTQLQQQVWVGDPAWLVID